MILHEDMEVFKLLISFEGLSIFSMGKRNEKNLELQGQTRQNLLMLVALSCFDSHLQPGVQANIVT